MTDEYLSLLRNNTWSLLELPANRKVFGCKWVYKVKENPNGSILKYKSRLVAKGFQQMASFDFTETLSPVVKPITICLVLILALTKGWFFCQGDVNNTFLNGDL